MAFISLESPADEMPTTVTPIFSRHEIVLFQRFLQRLGHNCVQDAIVLFEKRY